MSRSATVTEADLRTVRLREGRVVRRQVFAAPGCVLLGDATEHQGVVGGGGDIDQPDQTWLLPQLGDRARRPWTSRSASARAPVSAWRVVLASE